MDLGINTILKPATMTSWDDKDFICLLNYLTFDIMYQAVKCFTCSPPYSTGLCICRLQIFSLFRNPSQSQVSGELKARRN